MMYVTSYGSVWRMSDRKFHKLEKDLKDTGGCVVSLQDYGKLVINCTVDLEKMTEAAQHEWDRSYPPALRAVK
jgi:hypothetical protein